ncbi:MAG: 8-oxo-dGTP diphosphatase [Candidatus Micrarchaeota archaeon]|nr:8-oxo-dGTP diphosphatase [Candidatus Micrarchaeota archaeon]
MDDERVLLAMKKKGFGAGKWNGVGGKINSGETPEEAVIRETGEEVKVKPLSIAKVADIRFYFHNEADASDREGHHVAVYTCNKWDGVPRESDEMKPQWFKRTELPFEGMWAADRRWVPIVLDGKILQVEVLFDKKGSGVLDYSATERKRVKR